MNSLTSKRVGIVTGNHSGYVEAMFRCLEAGNIAVPLRRVDDGDRIQAARVDQVITPATAGAWFDQAFTTSESSDTALISFTSGTEGNPKGVLLTHHNLTDVTQRLNALMQIDGTISEYIGVPVCHSFGFGRCRAVASAGGRFLIPENGFNPSEIGSMLRRGEINAISAVPSLWRILIANQDFIGNSGKRVRWIEIGSQYMSRQEKESLKAIFPEARIIQHYGLTEASRTTLLEIHQAEGETLESVGQAFGEVELKLGEDGSIAIRGNHVAKAYLIADQEVEIKDREGWFLTKDLGSLKGDYLYYHGRSDDVINCGGIKIHPETLETKVYAQIGQTSGLAVCRKSDLARGEGFLVAVAQDSDIDKQQLRSAVLQAIQELGVNAANAITVIDVDRLPKTATGKIQRQKLAEWYASKAPEFEQPVETANPDRSPIQTIFCQVLNLREVHPQDTFISLGGDSLSFAQLTMQLERYLGYLPQDWEYLSIRQIEAIAPRKPATNSIIETNIFLRAIAICGVVFNHADLIPPSYINGGSMLLLLIAGLNFARFQKHNLFQTNPLISITPLIRNLIIPYLAISLVFQLLKREINPAVFLMADNFIHFQPEDLIVSPFPVWFIEVLVQCLIGFALILNIRPVHRFAHTSPWKFGLILLGLTSFISVVSKSLFFSGEIYQFPRLPHILFWIFIMGWCIHFARSKVQKIATSSIILICLMVNVSFYGAMTSEHSWILFGGMILLWLPYISLPLIFKRVMQTLGAAAYYIFLTHVLFLHLMTTLLKVENPLFNAAIALLGSLLVWASIQALKKIDFFNISRKEWVNHSQI